MQVLYPPSGLDSYPNQHLGEQIGSTMKGFGDMLLSFTKMKKDIDDEKAKKQLELYMKTGEIMGELDKPTPSIQAAFKKIYGSEPTGIFATGGETLLGKKTKAEIAETEAETTKKKAMGTWYSNRQLMDKNTDVKALDYAVKYANGKLGKPFDILSDEERGKWQQYHDEGLGEWFKIKGTTPKNNAPAARSSQATSFLNSWNALPDSEKNKITDPSRRVKLQNKLTKLGLTMGDLK